jgi:DNA primase
MNPEAAMRASTLAKVESKQDAVRAAMINGSEKSDKKKKKRSTETASQVSAPVSTSASATASTSTRAPVPAPAPPSYAQAAQVQATQSRSPAPQESPKTVAVPDATEAPEWAKQLISKHFQQSSAAPTPATAVKMDTEGLQEIVSAEITNCMNREMEIMYKRINEDKRVMNAANDAKQEAILRMVSSTLNDNVEGVIRKMVDDNIRNVVLPEVLAKTSATLEQGLGSNLKSALGPMLSKDHRKLRADGSCFGCDCRQSSHLKSI